MLQGMWRARKARRMLRKLISSSFEKVWDEENQRFYYINKKSGDASWEKPKALGAEDIDVSPRSRVAAEKAGVLRALVNRAGPGKAFPDVPLALPRWSDAAYAVTDAGVDVGYCLLAGM